MFTPWCEWVLRQAKSGPRQAKGTRAACPKDKLEFKFFFFEPCTGYLIGCHKKGEIVRYFQGRLCDKKGLLQDKLCDFFRAN